MKFTPKAEFCTPRTVDAIDMDAATAAVSMLKAVADPLRLRMLSAIANDERGEACVCDLETLADVSQPTVSHHLKVLKNAGLLGAERRGTWVYYRIADDRRHAVDTLLGLATLDPETDQAPETLELQESR